MLVLVLGMVMRSLSMCTGRRGRKDRREGDSGRICWIGSSLMFCRVEKIKSLFENIIV